MQDITAGKLIDHAGNPAGIHDSVKIVGIYFSAHWCPPCRNFTPVLAQAYTEHNENGQTLEIVFATSDQDEDSFQTYFKTMPWIALAFEDAKIKALKTKFAVNGIPRLVIINKATGEVINDNGRGDVQTNGPQAFADWASKC